MRTCLRCEKEMIEDLELKPDGALYGLSVTERGILKSSLGHVHCAVCPDCGYIEPYIEDTTKVKQTRK